MGLEERLFVSLAAAIFAGATLTACYLMSKQTSGPCVCRCARDEHAQRFGPPGRCNRCRDCDEYRPDEGWHA